MKGGSKTLIRIVVLTTALCCGYLTVRYVDYQKFVYAAYELNLSFRLPYFYAEHLRFPKSTEEYADFNRGDKEYLSQLKAIDFRLKYDSINEEIVFFSPGFDRDDDRLSSTYNPLDTDFLSSLTKDGDVIVQSYGIRDLLFMLKHKHAMLREGKPDSTLHGVSRKLWLITNCYLNSKIVDNIHRRVDPSPDASLDYGLAWVEFHKKHGSQSCKIISEVSATLLREIESGLISSVKEQSALDGEDNISIAFTVNLLNSFPCQE